MCAILLVVLILIVLLIVLVMDSRNKQRVRARIGVVGCFGIDRGPVLVPGTWIASARR